MCLTYCHGGAEEKPDDVLNINKPLYGVGSQFLCSLHLLGSLFLGCLRGHSLPQTVMGFVKRFFYDRLLGSGVVLALFIRASTMLHLCDRTAKGTPKTGWTWRILAVCFLGYGCVCFFGCLSVGLRNSRTHLPNEDNSPRRYGWDNHHCESLQLREPAPRLHFLTFPSRSIKFVINFHPIPIRTCQSWSASTERARVQAKCSFKAAETE